MDYYNVPQIDYINEETNEIKPTNLKQEFWHPFTKDTIAEVSAVGFYMLTKLRKSTSIPLAIVDNFKGGTSASAWVSLDELKRDVELDQAFVKPYQKAIQGKSWDDFEKETQSYNQLVQKHNDDLAAYLAKHPQTSLSDAKNVVGHTP